MDRPLLADSSHVPGFEHVQIRWEDKSFCCFHIAHFREGSFTVWGHWRVRLRVPVVVSVLFLLSQASFVYDTLTPTPFWWFVGGCCGVGFLGLCVVVSYVATIARGPGYVPYNWAVTRQKGYTWRQCMDNMVVFQEQSEYAKGAARPPRASFSIDARRFVLRADHFCVWLQSWIGIRNHRYFLLMTSYSFLHAVAYTAFRLWWFRGVLAGIHWRHCFGLAASAFVVGAGLFGLLWFVIGVRNLCDGVTAIEKWNKRRSEFTKETFCGNCEEVCGQRRWMLCWIIPLFCCLEPGEDGFYSQGIGNVYSDSEKGGRVIPL
jgi:hypothetical protein